MQSRHRDGGNRLVSGGGDRELFVWDVEVKDANADADGTRHPLSQFDLYAALTASDEVKLPTEQQQRQQLTVRQITSVIQGDVERLLVIVEQVPAVMVLTLNSDDDCLSLERIVKLSACPLDMSVDANGCVWMAVDDCAMPVIRHSFATESGAPLVTSLDASLAHSLASLASATLTADLWLDSTLRKGSFRPDAKAGGKRKRDELRDEEAVDAEA